MTKDIVKLEDYIRLKYSGNAEEWARETGRESENVKRMLKSNYYVDCTDGTLFLLVPAKTKGAK